MDGRDVGFRRPANGFINYQFFKCQNLKKKRNYLYYERYGNDAVFEQWMAYHDYRNHDSQSYKDLFGVENEYSIIGLVMMAMQDVRDLVARAYYNHGLFCSTHPLAIILAVGAVIFLCASPMVKLPLTSNAPHVYKSSAVGFSIPQRHTSEPADSSADPQVKPRWFVGAPLAFIQQFVVRAKVSPWHGDLTAEDAFRAPLSRAFKLVDDINQFHDKSGIPIQSFCMYVLDVNNPSEFSGILPEHGCLVISPAALWRNDMQVFTDDEDLVETIYSHLKKKSIEATNIKDVLFGIPGKFSGIHRFYIRSRQRLISYAVTVVLKSYNESFISDLKAHLHKKFGSELLENSEPREIKHLYFKERRNIVEISPLIFVYCLLFLYIYFSVSKIEMVKSKWGLAFSAVFQVISSLAMSVGICVLFGLTPTLHGGEIFPYLVIILGLENILVLTKSVVSTPVHLEVKKRIAQGLEKESWSISKNLFTELLIILMGYFTFVPAIQEFCVFAVVGLLTDFFLQMFFFVTVLSIDIRRMELSDLQKTSIQEELHTPPVSMTPRSISRTKSVPDSINMMSPIKQRMLQTRLPPATPLFRKIPKRLRLVYFWASTRVVQRLIMVSTVLWIIFTSLFVYKSGLVVHLTENHTNNTLRNQLTKSNDMLHKGDIGRPQDDSTHQSEQDSSRDVGYRKDMSMGKSHEGGAIQGLFLKEYYNDLSPLHWPTLFGYYNRTLKGRYISLLPPEHLFINIDPKEAIAMRSEGSQLLPDGLLDPDTDEDYLNDYQVRAYKLLQESKWDYYVTMSLGVASGASLVILILLLCKCVSLKRLRRQRYKKCRHDDIIRSVQNDNESVPLVLRGHKQDVECIVSEAGWIFSSCLSGEIRRWDPATGDCMLVIQRKSKPKNRVGPTCPCYDSYQTPSLSSTQIPRRRHPSAPDAQSHLHHTWRDVLNNQPDLTESIQTNFGEPVKDSDNPALQENSQYGLTSRSGDARSQTSPSGGYCGLTSRSGDARSQTSPSAGYCFNQRFHSYYESHPTSPKDGATQGFPRQHNMPSSIYGAYSSTQPQPNPVFIPGHNRSRSTGVLKIDTMSQPLRAPRNVAFKDDGQDEEHVFERGGYGECSEAQVVPPIWCLACNDTVIAAGCGNGRVEIWDAGNGTLLCYFESSASGVSAICIYANMLVVARLDGTIDFLHLVNSNATYVQDFKDSYEHKGSFNRHFIENEYFSGSMWECHRVCQMKAHQQLINEVVILNGQVVTASDDHTLKVFRLEDCLYLSTLRGHTGAVTVVTVDKTCSHTIASGSADGTVRVWDLLKCDPIYVLNGHVSSVLSVCCSADYVISIGSDDRLCVWRKTTRGRLIHIIQLDAGCGSSVITLADKIMVTAGKGCLVVWDVSTGEPLRKVDLGGAYLSVSQIIAIDHSSIACDCGEELRVITFPSQLRKDE